MCVKSQNNFREIRKPLLILKDPSISGSLIRPFHPTVVRCRQHPSQSKGGGCRLLEVCAHDNEDVLAQFVCKGF